MRQLIAFLKKEWLDLTRSGKLFLLILIFTLFGIMNPAIAKLTPWLMEMFSESLAEAGMSITEMEINAFTSWIQFYKNVPMALIIFILMFSAMLTNEYQKGTLINMLTKGLDRWKVIVAKAVVSITIWSIGYGLCYGITYCYNEYFWDNSIVSSPFFAAFCMYLFGVWTICLMLLLSAMFRSNSAVLIGTVLTIGVVYLAEFIPDIKEYLPTFLLTSQNLLSGIVKSVDYEKAMAVTGITSLGAILGAIVSFNKKSI